MAREKEEYRIVEKGICKRFPDKDTLTVHEVAEYCGITVNMAGRMFPFKGVKKGRFIDVHLFAMLLCNE